MKINKKEPLLLVATLFLTFTINGWIPFQNWWFNGKMRINSMNTQLSYEIVYWNPGNIWKIYPGFTLKATNNTTNDNTNIDILALMGGPGVCVHDILECLNMTWHSDYQIGETFVLAPNDPYVGFGGPDEEKKYYDDLHSGKRYPYLLITRNAEPVITIYIVGPTSSSKFTAQKLSFNLRAFEYTWLGPSWWYNGLGNDDPPGFSIACSFNADLGTFLPANPKDASSPLSNNAFYVAPLESPLSPNWITMGSKVMPNATLSIDALINGYQYKGSTYGAGIIEVQSYVDAQELQGVINFLNSTGFAKFENVYP